MKNIFNSVKVSVPSSNTFDLTHDLKMSGKMGQIMPILCMEVIPGDRIKLACDTMLRFAPLIAPVMHRFDVKTEYYFVPNRIIWSNWEKFICQENTGGIPTIQMDGTWTADEYRLADYLGVPPWGSTTGAVATQINALPFAAYQAIYNEWYRDQNLVTAIDYQLADGPQAVGIFATLRKRAWEHDYFTSALPFAQKGAAVTLPLGNVDITLSPDPWPGNNPLFREEDGSVTAGVLENVAGPGAGIYPQGSADPVAYDPAGTLVGTVGATTINDLRRAFRLQEFLEKMARGGTRYIEMIKMHFGKKSSDARLQRPEYITGSKQPVVISEVLNSTSNPDAEEPLGTMGGHGVSVGEGYVDTYDAEEHGYIIGVMSVMPKPAYQQGIPKTFLKSDPLDWFWPSFANIGEQAIEVQELYAYTLTRLDTFGYIPRYAEYKYMPPRVAGDFRTTLAHWTGGRIFAAEPTLSQAFIEMDFEELDRIFAVQDGEDNMWIHVLNKIKAERKMPVFGTPML